MADTFEGMPRPRYIRRLPCGEWEGAPGASGPWSPFPAPQQGTPWPAPPAAAPERHGPPEPAAAPEPPARPRIISYADRLALAICAASNGQRVCASACQGCRGDAAAVARETAVILRERYGDSATADWLDGVGCHERQGEGS